MIESQKSGIKLENEISIKNAGYRVNEWLPILDVSSLRPVEEIMGRMSVMTALLNIAFGAPNHIIKTWIINNGLLNYLSSEESEILEKENNKLTKSELGSIKWYLESLWSFMWLTELIAELAPDEYVGKNMASLLPNLKNGDDNKKLERIKTLQSVTTAYKMLDYYYRLHWYCVDERLNGRKAKLDEGLIYHRRKSLEWAFDQATNWDTVEMGT